MTIRRAELEAALARRLGSTTEARWLLDEVLAGERGPGAVLTGAQRGEADALAARRLAGEPLQYVLGTWSFRTLDLAVDRRVLIPRPETEQVVAVARRELDRLATLCGRRAGSDPGLPRRGLVAVDLGTGSGAIALSLAAEAGGLHAGLRVVATDRSADALEVAELNRRRLAAGAPDAANRVTFHRGAWWAALEPAWRGAVDLVGSNPPYGSTEVWPELPAVVRDHEPREARVAAAGTRGAPGLADIETLLAGAGSWLARPGTIVLELAPHQAAAARDAAGRAGSTEVAVHPDLAGRERTLVARW